MNQIDNLFRGKFEKHATKVPAGAWGKIEKNLTAKQNKFIWLKAAASLLLFASAAWIFLPNEDSKGLYISKQPKSLSKQPERLKSVTHRQETPVIKNIPARKELVQLEKSNTERKLNTKPKKPAQQEESAQSTNEIREPVITNEYPELHEKQNVVVADVTTPIPETETEMDFEQKNTSSTITLTAEEVNRKYLNVSVQEATQAHKKASVFKKLLSKARSLKENQDPFGDLREKKNEILAVNFSREKRKQN